MSKELSCPKPLNQEVLLRRSGNLLEISSSLKSLDQDVRFLIEPYLTYTYQQYLRGIDRYDPRTGIDKGPIKFEERKIYKYDQPGRLCCGIGFLPKIKKLLNLAKCNVTIQDCNPVHIRPNRFQEDWDAVSCSISFRSKQDECLLKIATNEYGVIQAPTGFGKGIIIAAACLLYPNAKIHVVTPSKDLVEKTVRSLSKYIPNIGQVGAGKKFVSRITVFSADSLHLSDGDVDILLADEIHELAAPSYSEPLAKYRYSRNFGFSATPEGRFDGSDAKLESLFGEKIFTLSYQEAVNLNLVVPIIVEWLDIRSSINPCENKKETSKKRWGIWRNEQRNQIIADKANSFDKDDQVLILVETVEHLFFLRSLLPDFSVCYSENGLSSKDMETYKKWKLMNSNEQPITFKEREKLRRDFESGTIKKAIATKIWATGVDFEGLSVLMRADATGSTIMDIQSPGRVSRINTKSAKPYGLVIDCMDHFDNGFKKKSTSRKKTYEKQGWLQILERKNNAR